MDIQVCESHIDLFLNHIVHERKCSQCTYRSYAGDLKQFITYWHTQNAKKNKDLSFQRATTTFFTMLKAQKLSASSIARKVSCLSSFKKYLIAQGHAYTLTVKRPHQDAYQPTFLTINEMIYLLDTIPTEELPSPFPCRDKAIIELLYATGMRCSELIALTIRMVNFDQNSIKVASENGRIRTVYFGQKAQERLNLYLSREHRDPLNKNAYLFLNYRTKPLTSRTVQRICTMFSTFLNPSKPITPQTIRNSFALHLLHKGADKDTVRKLLGYSTTVSIDKFIPILQEYSV